ncbi:sodium:calcium antiporter [Jeotgalibacillus salarius]|uniref:Sodium:calcium antiporter n=1 Tax=Jeotgalibacillus salarius TaxID=546023 RepID=A0A4Y8LD39_9BACL|nr:sodium:calcium antiporter [Jeotgalibacillus salarius]TFE00548.1 sodium:calcium antiporter [Jeotgalibacillus salarius]
MTWLYISIFIISAIISAYSAIHLSRHADTISKQTKLGGFLAGTLLLAVATSLPELTTTVSASVIGNADIAVGNGLGSIIFNTLVLFVLDIYFRKKRLFLSASHTHVYTGMIALLLCVVTAIGLITSFNISLFNIGLTSLIVTLIYVFGMWFISKTQEEPEPSEEIPPTKLSDNPSIRHAVKRFVIYAIAIFIFGSALSLSGDAISQSTGISATVVGSVLVALATSLPDAMGVFMALRLGNVNMAIGAILGSNVFNILVIAIGDVFYFEGSIWRDTSNELIYISIVGFLLTVLVMVIVKRDHTRNNFTYLLPSLLAIASYLIVIGVVLF